MLDKKIFNHIKTVRKFLPLAKLEMVSNDHVLNMVLRLQQLFESGLSTILISVYDSAEDAERFNVMCINAGVNSKQFVIRPSYLPEEQSFGISMNNRAGMMATATYDILALREPLKVPF